MQTDALVKLEKVAKLFGSRPVLKNVSLGLRKGDRYILTGDNGSGKTTLLRLIACLVTPDAGRVVHAPNLSIACLGHDTCLYPGLTALENLEFWSSASGQSRKKKSLLQALEEMNLLPFANEQARHFSRGMAQRLNFARVLLSQPSLLLLDEPFTGMDAKSIAHVGKKLTQYLDNGAAMIMTSHFPERDAVFAKSRIHIEKCALRHADGNGQKA